jgi:NSS family neurotransmitter:Na+ symporter
MVSASPREQWASKFGFLMAAVGSAVGLGNMWRFSYLTAEHGGAAFVVLYVGMVLLVGLPVLLAELVLGRGAGRSPIQALTHFGGNAWKPLGFLFVASGFLILAYYSVIAGWTMRYTIDAAFGSFGPDPAARFSAVSQGPQAILWHLLFMAVTIAIVARGIKSGIELTTTITMPLLFLVVCGLAVYAATLEGAEPGYSYYLQTDYHGILSRRVLSQAAGQAFFSLSLGMGAMLTYASYLSRDQHLPNESVIIAAADFAVAFIAGLVVFPLLFALGLSSQVGESTVGALFITLPGAFGRMGTAGQLVGVLFFSALVVGALTSAISLLEVVVASAMDGLQWSRHRSAIVLGSVIAVCGLPAASDIDILGAMDEVANNVFLLGGGLALAVFVGWVMPDPIGEVRTGAPGVRWFFLWRTLLRFVVPAVLLYILVDAIPRTLATLAGIVGSR